MDFRNCPKCYKLFRYVSRNLCPICIQAEEEEYTRIRKFVRYHEGVSISEVCEATGVSPKIIIRLLRDGGLIPKKIT